jgi:O-acetyl-ADP-ribose deacetylase (regulator of RNase III)
MGMDIQVFLRDKNINLVNAWTREFKGCQNVKISCGDIFEIKADAIISPANSFGFMDGGIDLVYSGYFGWELQDELQNKIRNCFYGELPVGVATIVETKNDDIKYLISCPTMRVPEDVSNTVNAYLAFRAGLIEAINFNKNNSEKITSILCPGLGTFSGMMPETICAKQMKHAYDSIFSHGNYFPSDLWAARDSHISLKAKSEDSV